MPVRDDNPEAPRRTLAILLAISLSCACRGDDAVPRDAAGVTGRPVDAAEPADARSGRAGLPPRAEREDAALAAVASAPRFSTSLPLFGSCLTDGKYRTTCTEWYVKDGIDPVPYREACGRKTDPSSWAEGKRCPATVGQRRLFAGCTSEGGTALGRVSADWYYEPGDSREFAVRNCAGLGRTLVAP
jgi:hypothetical protein